jgi:hypothetical protein
MCVNFQLICFKIELTIAVSEFNQYGISSLCLFVFSRPPIENFIEFTKLYLQGVDKHVHYSLSLLVTLGCQ